MCECAGREMRGFFTKKERLEMLKGYKESLENEASGVEDRIKELERSK